MKSIQWTFTEEELSELHSKSNTISYEEKEEMIETGIRHIERLCKELSLKDNVYSSACILLRRFYVDHSINEYHLYVMCQACLLLACKTEESLRKLGDIIKAHQFVLQLYNDTENLIPDGNENSPSSSTFTPPTPLSGLNSDEEINESKKTQVIIYERILLDSVHYNINIPNVYNEFRKLRSTFDSYEDSDFEITNGIKATAKKVFKELHTTNIYLRYSCHAIAAGYLYFCFHVNSNGETDKKIFEYLDEDEKTVLDIFDIISSL